MAFPNMVFGADGMEDVQSSVANRPLGDLMMLSGNRRFRYAKNGATAAATAGLLFQSAAVTTAAGIGLLTSMAIEAVAVGTKDITLSTIVGTALATTIAAETLKDGYMITMTSGAGGGQFYVIESQDAMTSLAVNSTACIHLRTGVKTALSSSVRVSLHRNAFSAVIVHPSPPTAKVVGWTMTSLLASNYGWLQTAGPAAGLVDRDPVIYQGLTPSTALDGAVNQAYIRLEANTSAVAFTSGSPTSLTFELAGSTGGAAAIGVFATSTALASAAGVPHDAGMQQPVVAYAMQKDLTSGSYGAIWAALEG